jgi:hypothetical protein
VAFHGPEAWKPLFGAARKVCQDCHSAETGIRSPLLQQHVATARYLEHHGTNQFGYTVAAVSKVASAMPPPDAESAQSGLSARLAVREIGRDQVTSPLVVRVSTSFGEFEMSNIPTTGTAACSAGDCEAKLTLDFRQAETGVALRDQHLHSRILSTPESQKAMVVVRCVEAQMPQTSPSACSARIHWRGKEAGSKVTAQIQRVDGGFAISSLAAEGSLRAFGLEPPRFLAVSVADSFHIASAGGSYLFIARAD